MTRHQQISSRLSQNMIKEKMTINDGKPQIGRNWH